MKPTLSALLTVVNALIFGLTPFIADRVSSIWDSLKSNIKRTLVIAPMLGMLYAGAVRADEYIETNKVVNIWEGGAVLSQPGIISTNLYWDFVVKNNSDIFPPIGKEIYEVQFYDIYSSSEPQGNGIDTDWTLNTSPGSSSNLWNIQIITSFPWSYIPSGILKNFPIITFVPSTNDNIKVGDLYGKVHFDGISGLKPDSPGEPFEGPVRLKSKYTLTVVSEDNRGNPYPGTMTNVVEDTVVTQYIDRVVNGSPGTRYKVIDHKIENK